MTEKNLTPGEWIREFAKLNKEANDRWIEELQQNKLSEQMLKSADKRLRANVNYKLPKELKMNRKKWEDAFGMMRKEEKEEEKIELKAVTREEYHKKMRDFIIRMITDIKEHFSDIRTYDVKRFLKAIDKIEKEFAPYSVSEVVTVLARSRSTFGKIDELAAQMEEEIQDLVANKELFSDGDYEEHKRLFIEQESKKNKQEEKVEEEDDDDE